MEGIGIRLSADSTLAASIFSAKQSNQSIEAKLLKFDDGEDSAEVGLDGVYKSLTVLADEIIAKLDELLKEDLAGGIKGLDPEQHTPQKTAERIVQGSTALFSAFAQQNPDLEGEELITRFMSTIRGGIETGYRQATSVLGDLGAFEFDGVQAGIEETMRLVEEMLVSFEDDYRRKNGLSPIKEAPEPAADAAAKSVTTQLEVQAGTKINYAA